MSDNVYKKLQSARVALQGMKLKESGKNTFANYSYMELGDFLPQINNLCLEHGLCGVINFADVATLTIVNIDTPEEQIVFSSPMSTAELKGCHAIQNLGAVQSYLRRYLWLACFEIVEHDALDSTQGKEKPAPQAEKPVVKKDAPATEKKEPATEEQRVKITDLCIAIGEITQEPVDKILKEVSLFEGKNGTFFLTMLTLAEKCTKGWAEKIIAAAEAKYIAVNDVPF